MRHLEHGEVETVGNFYATRILARTFSTENRKNLPFIQFGTAIATYIPSTWFHAMKGRCSGSLVQLHRPFLVSGAPLFI